MNATAPMSRQEARAGMPNEIRLRLLEDDLDTQEAGMAALREEIRAQGDRTSVTLNRILWAVLSLLFTIVGGLIMTIVQVVR